MKSRKKQRMTYVTGKKKHSILKIIHTFCICIEFFIKTDYKTLYSCCNLQQSENQSILFLLYGVNLTFKPQQIKVFLNMF